MSDSEVLTERSAADDFGANGEVLDEPVAQADKRRTPDYRTLRGKAKARPAKGVSFTGFFGRFV